MEMLAEVTKLIMTDKGLNKYAEIVAETDIAHTGTNLCLLESDKYVRKLRTSPYKEKTNGRY